MGGVSLRVRFFHSRFAEHQPGGCKEVKINFFSLWQVVIVHSPCGLYERLRQGYYLFCVFGDEFIATQPDRSPSNGCSQG